MNLFEISHEILNCIQVSDDEVINTETGEIFDASYLDQLQMDRDTKIKNLLQWVVNNNASINACKEQEKKFKEKRAKLEKRNESLKAYLSQILDGKKFTADDESVSASFRKSESVNVEKCDLSALRDEYVRIIPATLEADKKAIKEALKVGLEVPGAYIEEKYNIQIK